MPSCPFCVLPADRIVLQNSSAVAIYDAYPISPGHLLIIPTRHVASWFDTSDTEKQDMLKLLETARSYLHNAHQADGYNIGINDGAVAGQTVPHLHIHLIPRYVDDVSDPRGGVRWIFPDKAKYWE